MSREPVIASSAYKHGETDSHILHGLSNPLHVHAVDGEGLTMVVGAAQDSRLLEIGFVLADDGTLVVVHAMRARSKFLRGW